MQQYQLAGSAHRCVRRYDTHHRYGALLTGVHYTGCTVQLMLCCLIHTTCFDEEGVLLLRYYCSTRRSKQHALGSATPTVQHTRQCNVNQPAVRRGGGGGVYHSYARTTRGARLRTTGYTSALANYRSSYGAMVACLGERDRGSAQLSDATRSLQEQKSTTSKYYYYCTVCTTSSSTSTTVTSSGAVLPAAQFQNQLATSNF